MYNINDESAPVREVQKYLLVISRNDDRIPRVSIDGIYGEETRNSVRAFQGVHNLPQTGTVDSVTFRILIREYRNAQEIGEVSLGLTFPENYLEGKRISPGDVFDFVYIIQYILNELSAYHDAIEEVDYTGKHDEKTQKSLREFKKISGLEDDGYIDKKTWNELVRSYNHYGSMSM